jgi:hypothetical protein
MTHSAIIVPSSQLFLTAILSGFRNCFLANSFFMSQIQSHYVEAISHEKKIWIPRNNEEQKKTSDSLKKCPRKFTKSVHENFRKERWCS